MTLSIITYLKAQSCQTKMFSRSIDRGLISLSREPTTTVSCSEISISSFKQMKELINLAAVKRTLLSRLILTNLMQTQSMKLIEKLLNIG